MKVRDVMTVDVLTADPDTTVNRIAQLMNSRAVSGIPVIDGARHVVGMVTELDLIVRNTRLDPPAFFPILDGRIPLETPGHYRKRLQHMLGTRAAEVMTEKVVTIGPEAEVEDLAELMMRRRVNPVPVVESDKLVGIVSRADLIRMMSRELEADSGS
jgi:CBS domain-containing protein